MSSLHVDRVGPEDGRVALVAHGILGMGRNWRSMARRMTRALPGWQFVLVDLRNHGESQGFTAPHTVAACAADLEQLAGQLGAVEVAVGHSFGGKVVLQWLADGAQLEQVWVLDSPPGPRPVDPQAVDTLGVIEAVRSVPMPAPDRDDIRVVLRDRGLPEPLIAWLLTSTRSDDQGWHWVWDLDAIDAMIRDYLELDLMPFLTAGSDVPVELVRAARSDRWRPSEVDALGGGGVRGISLHTLSNAGHWVHVDDPLGLLALFEAHWVR